jgi:hypothetical protein
VVVEAGNQRGVVQDRRRPATLDTRIEKFLLVDGHLWGRSIGSEIRRGGDEGRLPFVMQFKM